MGSSEEGVLFVPCLGRADATQGPRAEISTPPLGVGSAGAVGGGGAQAPRERRWGGGGAGPEARGGRSGDWAAVATDARRWRRPTPVHMDSRRGLG